MRAGGGERGGAVVVGSVAGRRGKRGKCDGGECGPEGASKVSAVVVMLSAGWRGRANEVSAVVVVVVDW